MVRRSSAGGRYHLNPPLWLDALLRGMLHPRDRDIISGDLWEAYREDVFPAVGVFRARLWYLRQVLSLVSWPGLALLGGSLLRRTQMSKNVAIAWVSGGIVTLSLVIFVLIRSGFAPPFAPSIAIAMASVPALAAITSLRTLAGLGFLWRAALVWAAALAATIVVRFAADWIAPPDVERLFIAQARAPFPELHEPRRFLFGLAIALLLIAAGCHGAWRTSDARRGILTAMVAGLIVVAPVFAVLALSRTTSPELVAPFAMLSIATVLGTIGALFGKGLSGLRRVTPVL